MALIKWALLLSNISTPQQSAMVNTISPPTPFDFAEHEDDEDEEDGAKVNTKMNETKQHSCKIQ